MVRQYRDGIIHEAEAPAMKVHAEQTIIAVQDAFDRFEFSKGLEAAWALIGAVDKFIVEQAPWKQAKNPEPNGLDATLYTAAEALRVVTALLSPVLPQSTAKIWAQLGMTEPLESVKFETLHWGGLKSGHKIGEISPVFPRIELKDAVARMRELEEKISAEQAVLMGKKPEAAEAAEAGSPKIPIDDFLKVDLRVGLVVSAERVKGSDKLMHMKVDIGEPQPRTIMAGIAEAYAPEQLLNRKVVIVANLQPRKLKGVESNGMIVAASLEGGKPVLAGFHEEIEPGARLK
jgi:methionyl-tRNA synthetase